jgi:hypothetical protein
MKKLHLVRPQRTCLAETIERSDRVAAYSVCVTPFLALHSAVYQLWRLTANACSEFSDLGSPTPTRAPATLAAILSPSAMVSAEAHGA